ncbi:transporter substrate-binding domain-containing protein [Colwellia sp. MB02u-18]|uniref:substrate-binding periplasmic protein n=1 Tax=unclassified Colwellia TaxID=196834 RepID=UPI0015F5F0EF|nr:MULTISPECIES: transporter substrate-binding domain-containing protein [unclassified Colwellia]MBA6224895.1 transporter substrate-binding domain-containing protein [Colwellia sp. MB3u-45]MBA6268817.1 transporter substrate-binding domain-containing protein [Colwellia sp. MB3u-43]MBA6321248.1 transporter substrate-binding domain-containing protein [Colwellia sp. MB02u-19]MBA6325801.1 transporter substrate-binding domain-containing protein [Colwellia sp. MB02u-18]MBA6332276.1 transporter substr
MFKHNACYKFTLVILLSLLIPNHSFAAVKTLTCATTHYPPYTIFDQSNDRFTGLDMAIIDPVFKQLNYDVKIVNIPWARLKKEIKKNTYDCYFSLAKLKDREQFLEYSNKPTHISRISIFYPENLQTSDLSGKKVGVYRGINFHQDILSFNGLRTSDFHELPSNEVLFQMLSLKRLDAVVTSKVVGKYILQNQYVDFKVEVLDIAEYKLPVYLAFKKGVIDINRVNTVLLKVINSLKPVPK